MKQILQSLRTGEVEVADVPCPAVGDGEVLIRSARSLISAGTERMLTSFGRAGLIGKARRHPDGVRQVIDKVRTDGLAPALEAAFRKLDRPHPLGYCNVGIVLESGRGVTGLTPGDRVVSNGRHAEVVAVPVNLVAKVPDGVSDDEAAFTVLGAVALQGIRLAQPTLGEAVVVTGLGLVGLIAVQLLRAQGCRVLALDKDATRLRLARAFGAETVDLSAGADPVAAALAFSRQRGVDAVIIAAATSSSEPVHQAARMSRRRGRLVLVGVTGLELSRADFYEKELTFQVSCSYGPGRHDPNYEGAGQDYPVGFVRWTAQRNFEAVLDMLAERRLVTGPLISHRFAIAEAERAYDLIAGTTPSLGILLSYPDETTRPAGDLLRRSVALRPAPAKAGGVGLGIVGAGDHAGTLLIPAFKAAGARLESIASLGGVSGLHAARRFGFAQATTRVDDLLADPAVDAVVIATRHDSHAGLACRALAAGKHLFVEKPLALTMEEIGAIGTARAEAFAAGFAPIVMVGFNRRFAPHAVRLRELLATTSGPRSFVMTVNAGALPATHWVRDRRRGGGRIVGEACHFVDFLRFLADAPITAHRVLTMADGTGETTTMSLAFAGGSIGTIHYFANGSRAFPKERLEVFAGGRVLQLDNFRRLRGFGWPGFRGLDLWRQDKGHADCAAAFLRSITAGGPEPIPFDELVEIAATTIALAEEARA